MDKSRIVGMFIIVIIALAAFIFYYYQQSSVDYSTCTSCDGNHYHKMYEAFKGNISIYQEQFPYYSRVLVPGLAALLPLQEALASFQIINLIFSLLSIAALYYLWIKLEIPSYLIIIGFFWLIFHWIGIIRLNAFDPYTVDVPLYFIQTIFVLIILSKRYSWLCLLGPVAVLQKESIIALMLVLILFAFINNKLQDEKESMPVITICIALSLTILTKYLFTLKFPPLPTDKSSVRTVLFYLRESLFNPFKLVRWLVAIFMAFGPLLILTLLKIRKQHIASPSMSFIMVMSLTYFSLGLLGGADNTRIIFLGFPFIMTGILLIIRDLSWKINLIALLLSIFITKLWTAIPNPGKDFYNFASWYPEYATVNIVLVWGGFFIFCFGVLFLTDRLIKK